MFLQNKYFTSLFCVNISLHMFWELQNELIYIRFKHYTVFQTQQRRNALLITFTGYVRLIFFPAHWLSCADKCSLVILDIKQITLGTDLGHFGLVFHMNGGRRMSKDTCKLIIFLWEDDETNILINKVWYRDQSTCGWCRKYGKPNGHLEISQI